MRHKAPCDRLPTGAALARLDHALRASDVPNTVLAKRFSVHPDYIHQRMLELGLRVLRVAGNGDFTVRGDDNGASMKDFDV